jgi:ABC-type branched-subunit amino acid transport system substrate-binding protein
VRILSWLLPLLGLLATATPSLAQSAATTTEPYATLDRQGVTYRGPVSATEKNDADGTAIIGMILPLKGPQQLEGKLLLAAAQLAIEEEQSLGPLADGRHLELLARDESGPWGQASSEILKLIEQDHALVILTSANGTSAHLAEQIANKISIPILTLSSDPSTTQANVPWLFRLGPSDADQARAFCQRIYSDLGLKRVLLIVQMDHDGRIGGAEFEKVTKELNVPAPLRFVRTDSPTNLESFREILRTDEPDAIVFWTDAPAADELLPLVRGTRPSTPVFLCRKAAQLDARGTHTESAAESKQQAQSSGELFTVDLAEQGQVSTQTKFQPLYFAQTGTYAGLGANEIYVAVHMIAAAVRSTGANRILLRDYFANEGKSRRTEDNVPFDPAGNSLQDFTIVTLQEPCLAKP